MVTADIEQLTVQSVDHSVDTAMVYGRDVREPTTVGEAAVIVHDDTRHQLQRRRQHMMSLAESQQRFPDVWEAADWTNALASEMSDDERCRTPVTEGYRPAGYSDVDEED